VRVSVVLVSGAAGVVGRRLLVVLAESPDVDLVVALDRRAIPLDHPKVATHTVHLAKGEGLPALDAADVLVHLAFGSDDMGGRTARHANVAATRRLLQLATDAGVRHVVLLSSAMVYGAWPNNPVPITEDAPLRPNPEFTDAVQRAQVEQLLDDWRSAGADRTVCVLRPCTYLSEDDAPALAHAVAAGAGVLAPVSDPAMQFLHLDDVVAAVDLARTARLDAVFNVAPDGWVDGSTVRALAGRPARLRLPSPVLRAVTALRWRFQRGPIPPGLLPYLSHPWLVANDRLKAAGWKPTVTNEQAYVAGTETKWWQILSPQRRQELALGVSGALLIGLVATTVVVVRRLVRRRRTA
jgi:nucleoside-diphosphate-sugar epimerase